MAKIIDIKTRKEIIKAEVPEEEFNISSNEMASTIILGKLAPKLLALSNELSWKEEISDPDEVARYLSAIDELIDGIAHNEGLDL